MSLGRETKGKNVLCNITTLKQYFVQKSEMATVSVTYDVPEAALAEMSPSNRLFGSFIHFYSLNKAVLCKNCFADTMKTSKSNLKHFGTV